MEPVVTPIPAQLVPGLGIYGGSSKAENSNRLAVRMLPPYLREMFCRQLFQSKSPMSCRYVIP